MRTNTWLGLMFFGDTVDSITRSLEAKVQRDQLDRIAAAQAARDQVRDEKFDQAMSGLHRGQFAMWIQTADGERFEAWAGHALQASQALDDRQDAWELAWVEIEQRRREQALAQQEADRQAALERYVTARFVPAERRDVARDKHAAGGWGVVFASGIILAAAALAIAPNSASGAPLMILATLLATLIVGGFVGAAYFTLQWLYGGIGPARDDTFLRHQLEREFTNTHRNVEETFSPPSWHATADGARLRELSLQLGTTAAEAHKIFPRKDQLIPLAGAYRTRADLDLVDPPSNAVRLLELFRAEDAERLKKLRAAGLS